MRDWRYYPAVYLHWKPDRKPHKLFIQPMRLFCVNVLSLAALLTEPGSVMMSFWALSPLVTERHSVIS